MAYISYLVIHTHNFAPIAQSVCVCVCSSTVLVMNFDNMHIDFALYLQMYALSTFVMVLLAHHKDLNIILQMQTTHISAHVHNLVAVPRCISHVILVVLL